MAGSRRLRVLGAVACLLTARSVLGWEANVIGTASPPAGGALAVAVDAAGDVIAGGSITNAVTGEDFAVVKLAGATGTTHWRYVLSGSDASNEAARTVAVDDAGDIFASGTTGEWPPRTIVKLAGFDGSELWKEYAPESRSIALDPHGDVFAGGGFSVSKFAGTTGQLMWSDSITDGTIVNQLTVDSHGDVVAGGFIPSSSQPQIRAMKYAGATGNLTWDVSIPNGGVSLVAVDPAADVILVGSGGPSTIVRVAAIVAIKLSGSTGAELWRNDENRCGGFDQAYSVAVDHNSDVFIAGDTHGCTTYDDFTVYKLRADDGAMAWLATIDRGRNDYAQAVAVDQAGDVVATGHDSNGSMLTAKFAAADGTPLWQFTSSRFGLGSALTTDAQDDVVTGGSLQDPGSGFDYEDFAVVKLRGLDGGDFQCGDGVVQAGEQCDQGAANGTASSCCTIACIFRSTGTPCAGGACDGAGMCVTTTTTSTTTTSTSTTSSTTSTSSTTTSTTTTSATATTTTTSTVPTTITTTTTVPHVCGNGVVEPGEQCDDGPATGQPGDCCTATCQFQPAGTTCTDEGDLCTVDVCDATGSCTHPIAPSPTCTTPARAGGATLLLQALVPGHNRGQFKWGKGPVVPLAEFGDPVGGERTRLCVYDQSAPNTYVLALRGAPSVNGGGVWTLSATGWKFRSTTGAPDGITGVTLKSGTTPLKAKVLVRATADPTFPAGLPLRNNPTVVAQFKTSRGTCWGAVFSAPTLNTVTEFKAKSD